MRALSAVLLTILWIPPAAAIDRADPTGDYYADTTLSLMVAGNKAVVYYWGDDVGSAHRGCSCEYVFERRADGRWISTTDPEITLKLDGKGFRIEDRWVHCCGSGVAAPGAQYADGTRDTCRVTGKTTPHLEPGTVVTAVTAPEWASFEDHAPGEGDSRPQYLVHARVGKADQILLVPASELSCKSAAATAAGLLTLGEAHASALALFKSGKAREAAQTLGKAAGPKPWNISRDVLTIYNDWGFFLEEAKQYPEAIEVLSAVVAAFPDRTPAYLNQGDAYVGLGDTAKAKAAYQRYADLMKKAGLERKIPDRVKKAIQD